MLKNPISDYLSMVPELKENANFNRSASGMEAYIAHKTTKEYMLGERYPQWVGKLHYDGDLHVHNLTQGLIPYCFGADLLLLLHKGLISDRIVSSPAKHLDSAVDHIVNFLGMNQQEWAGAQAFSHVNTLLAPLAVGMSYKAIKQNMQRLIFNLNLPSRSGYQTIFSNVILDFKTPKYYRDQNVIVGGEVLRDTYEDFEEEAEKIHKAFWEVLTRGDVRGNIFTFPIPTENITKDTKWDTELMDLIIHNTIHRGQAYFFNYWGTGIDEDTVRALCCRLTLDLSQLPPAGGRWAYEGGTGSIGVVTINMGRIGYLSRTEYEIFERLEYLMHRAKEILLLKEEIVTYSRDVDRLMPLARFYDISFDRFFRTIGIVGFNELFENFAGSPLSQNMKLAIKILDYMRDKTLEFQKETGRLWNLEMTPAEGSSWRLATLDRQFYPDIMTQGNASGYYYSAMIPPSNQDMSFGDMLYMGQELLPKFTGGTVFRLFLGEQEPSHEATKTLIKRMSSSSTIPYFDFAATFSICVDCGHDMRGSCITCDRCGGSTKTYSRTVGYYRPVSNYNKGKLNEFKERVYHTI